MILESALSQLNDDEMNLITKEPYAPLINLLNSVDPQDNPYKKVIDTLCQNIAGIDYNNSNSRMVGISYSITKNRYTAEKTINGKYYFIKCSINKNTCEQALISFCEQHKISPYERSDKSI